MTIYKGQFKNGETDDVFYPQTLTDIVFNSEGKNILLQEIIVAF